MELLYKTDIVLEELFPYNVELSENLFVSYFNHCNAKTAAGNVIDSNASSR